MEMETAAFNEEKFRELVLYIAEQCERLPLFGATKLYDILYCSDFEMYRRTGHSITAATYVAMKYGPVPEQRDVIKDRMIREGELALRRRGTQKRYIALREADRGQFTVDEICIVHEVIERFKNDAADTVSERSYQDSLGWLAAYLEGVAVNNPVRIPYETVFVSNRRMDAFGEVR